MLKRKTKLHFRNTPYKHPPTQHTNKQHFDINDIYNDTDYLRRVVKMGAEKARESASKTLREVREILGYRTW